MTNADKQIPVVVGIDVEPDPRLTDPRHPDPWRGFEQLHPFIMELRTHLAARSRAHPQFCWFFRLDPQVAETYGDPAWALKRYEREIAALVAAGDEIGVHTHAYRWEPTRANWIVDEANQAWVDHCVTSSCHAFEKFFHRSSRAHKFGDRWLSTATIARLETLGVRIDLTLEPGVRSPWMTPNEVHTGAPPVWTHALRRPYRPSPEDFLRADPSGTRRLWLLPLSTWRVPWFVQLPRRTYHRLRPAHGGPTPGDESSQATVTLRPGFRPYLFRSLVKRLLNSGEATHLALIFRSNEGTSPLQRQRIATNLMSLLSHPLANRVHFVGPEAALDLLGHAAAGA